jgi:hypothetical protein
MKLFVATDDAEKAEHCVDFASEMHCSCARAGTTKRAATRAGDLIAVGTVEVEMYALWCAVDVCSLVPVN